MKIAILISVLYKYYYFVCLFFENTRKKKIRDLSEISGGEGGWKQREGHNFLRLRKRRGHEKWAVKRGRVMQTCARDYVEVHPQKKKEVLSLVKKSWEK